MVTGDSSAEAANANGPSPQPMVDTKVTVYSLMNPCGCRFIRMANSETVGISNMSISSPFYLCPPILCAIQFTIEPITNELVNR